MNTLTKMILVAAAAAAGVASTGASAANDTALLKTLAGAPAAANDTKLLGKANAQCKGSGPTNSCRRDSDCCSNRCSAAVQPIGRFCCTPDPGRNCTWPNPTCICQPY